MHSIQRSVSQAHWDRKLLVKTAVKAVAPGGGGTPLYRLYRYVRPERVWVFSRFGNK